MTRAVDSNRCGESLSLFSLDLYPLVGISIRGTRRGKTFISRARISSKRPKNFWVSMVMTVKIEFGGGMLILPHPKVQDSLRLG